MSTDPDPAARPEADAAPSAEYARPDFAAPAGFDQGMITPPLRDHSAWLPDPQFAVAPENLSRGERFQRSASNWWNGVTENWGIKLIVLGAVALTLGAFVYMILQIPTSVERREVRESAEAVAPPWAPQQGTKAKKPDVVYPLGKEDSFEFSGSYITDAHLLAVLEIGNAPPVDRQVGGKFVGVKVSIAPSPGMRAATLRTISIIRLVDTKGIVHEPMQIREHEAPNLIPWWSESAITERTGYIYFFLDTQDMPAQVHFGSVAWDPTKK